VQAVSGDVSELTLVFNVDILDASVRNADKIDQLFLISREAIQKGRLDAVWKEKFSTSPKALKPILLSEGVLDEMRKILWRESKLRVETSELRVAVEAMIRD
jgi:hypothetical protein